MEIAYPCAVRFLSSDHPDDFFREIVKSSELIRTPSGCERFFSLDIARMGDIRKEKDVSELLPLIESSVASKKLQSLVCEIIGKDSIERWKFCPRFQEPFWVEIIFDRNRSTPTKEREKCNLLRSLVDKRVMDVTACQHGYYGFAPLVYLYHKTVNDESEDSCAVSYALEADLFRAFGQLEDMRKLELHLMPYSHAEKWGRAWNKSNVR
ncbi:MAG: hypothetical protein HOP33_23080 [Verrucomicrobia bacterium]|nr:hypothetical protein [Verrucomicrobiota bacterium]